MVGPRYALVPSQVSFHETVGLRSRAVPCSPVRAIQYGQSILARERERHETRVVHQIGQREFKTRLVEVAMDDAFGSEEGREAFRRFNVQFDALFLADGTLQGSVEDICDPLLPKVGGGGVDQSLQLRSVRYNEFHILQFDITNSDSQRGWVGAGEDPAGGSV